MPDPALPPARTAPGVAVATGSGVTAMAASTFQWLMTWPIAPPTYEQALNVTGLIAALASVCFHLWANRRASPDPTTTQETNQ